MDVKALVEKPANQLSEIKTETLAYALRHAYWTRWRPRFLQVQAKSVTDTLTRYYT